MRKAFMLAALAFSASTGARAQSTDPAGPDWDAIKKESEASKAASDARAAAANAKAAEAAAATAATKAQFGALGDYSRDGTTTVGDKAGQLESAMLSAESTRRLSALIVRDMCIRAASLCNAATAATSAPASSADATQALGICGDLVASSAGGEKLYIVTEAEKLTFDTADAVQAALCGAQGKLRRAIAMSEGLNSGTSPALALPGALTAVSVIGNLLRSDYAVQGVVITPDDLLLAKAVATAGQGSVMVPMLIPSIYRPAALTADNPLMAAIGAINGLREQAVTLAKGHKATAAALAKRGKAFAARAKAQSDIAAELDAAVKGYDDYFAKIATPSDKGVSELAEAARQTRIRTDLAAGSYVLSLKMNAAGGTTYSKKGFFSGMTGVPFYVSGGSVASFTLLNGQTGQVVGAGTYSASGGFQQIGNLHASRARQ